MRSCKRYCKEVQKGESYIEKQKCQKAITTRKWTPPGQRNRDAHVQVMNFLPQLLDRAPVELLLHAEFQKLPYLRQYIFAAKNAFSQ